MSEFFGSIDAVNVGGALITDIDNFKMLRSRADGSYNVFRDPSALTTAGFQVATNTVFECRAIEISYVVDAATNNHAVVLGYSDTDIGVGSATQGANGLWFAQGATTTPQILNDNAYGVGNFLTNTSEVFFRAPMAKERIPAGKYMINDAVTTTIRAQINIYGLIINV